MNRSSGLKCIASLTVALMLGACAMDNEESEDFEQDEPAQLGELAQELAAGQVVKFQNSKSGRCIGVDGASTANGALLKQFTCADAANQRWEVRRSGTKHMFINAKSGKCMGVDGASVSPGANIGQYNCGNFAPNQSWVMADGDNDLRFNLVNDKSGLCIGVDGGSTANGAQLKQFGCNFTAPNQDWSVILQ